MYASIVTAGIKYIGGYSKAVPNYDGRFKVEGIDSDSEIIRDEYGIPTCIAKSEKTLFFLNGVCHGQDRLWQLHALRTAAAGRLSEFAGEKAVEVDIMARQINFYNNAKEDWELIQGLNEKGDADARQAYVALVGYTEGVNWAVKHAAKLPVEFALTGQSPFREWNPVDSIAISRILAFGMCFGAGHVILRQAMHDVLGEEAAKEWTRTSSGMGDGPTASDSCDVEAVYKRALKSALSTAPKAAGSANLGREEGQGSNWWVVSGSHTESGRPILAADPHLTVKVPQCNLILKGDSKDNPQGDGEEEEKEEGKKPKATSGGK
eukprot:jgi/Bigna1/126115/aug1.2_g823